MLTKQVGDILVLVCVLILFLLGVFVLYTTSPIGVSVSSWVDSLVIKQLLFGAIGVAILVILLRFDLQILRTGFMQVLLVGFIVLLLLGIFAFPALNGAHRWYIIGQFLLQPSEYAKIALALWSAFWLTQEHMPVAKRLGWLALGLIPAVLLIFLEPDVGSTIDILIIVFAITAVWVSKYALGRILLGYVSWAALCFFLSFTLSLWFLLGLIPALAFITKMQVNAAKIAIVVTLLATLFVGVGAWWWQNPQVGHLTYVRKRLESFTGTSEELWQITQSKIAVGSGQWWGKGLAQGTQSRLRFLPEYTTDFIFAAFVEERGYVGMLLLILVYLTLLARLLYLAVQVPDEYVRLVIIGLAVKIWFETLVNIGMNMGVLPTKGVALPFVSYGGSSLLANVIIIGIILSLYRSEAKHDTISPSFGLA